MRKFKRNPIVRLKQFSELKKSGCIEWNGEIINNGYGRLSINRKKTLAHRYSYEISKGKIPERMMVLHKCDNRKCINPDHLYLGDAKINAQDMKNRNRINRKGEFNSQSKLTEDKVRQIRVLSKLIKINDIAKIYNVSYSVVRNVIKNITWKHVF